MAAASAWWCFSFVPMDIISSSPSSSADEERSTLSSAMCKLLIKRFWGGRPIMDASLLNLFSSWFWRNYCSSFDFFSFTHTMWAGCGCKTGPPIRIIVELYCWVKTCMWVFRGIWGNWCVQCHWAGADGLGGRKRLTESVVGTPTESPVTTTWPGFVILEVEPGILLAYPGFDSCCLQEIKASSSLGGLISSI